MKKTPKNCNFKYFFIQTNDSCNTELEHNNTDFSSIENIRILFTVCMLFPSQLKYHVQ